MSGLVNGLQNRLQQFESARHLSKNRQNLHRQRGLGGFLFMQCEKTSSSEKNTHGVDQKNIHVFFHAGHVFFHTGHVFFHGDYGFYSGESVCKLNHVSSYQ